MVRDVKKIDDTHTKIKEAEGRGKKAVVSAVGTEGQTAFYGSDALRTDPLHHSPFTIAYSLPFVFPVS